MTWPMCIDRALGPRPVYKYARCVPVAKDASTQSRAVPKSLWEKTMPRRKNGAMPFVPPPLVRCWLPARAPPSVACFLQPLQKGLINGLRPESCEDAAIVHTPRARGGNTPRRHNVLLALCAAGIPTRRGTTSSPTNQRRSKA
ncbi:hypothetical protein TcBrA4_0070520 [Trypanosoma cruzi]|nr:hypothetical protein TcBrA4_0070520 [Trypanosoma cruzi]